MNTKWTLIIGVLVVVAGIVGLKSVYTVFQTEQVIVLEFGNPKRVIKDPGLNFKVPWEDIVSYDNRVLNLDPPVEQVILADQNRLLVDAFARYRIEDPLEFYKAVRTENEVRTRLGPIVNAALRGVLGNVTLASILSEERDDVMVQIREQVNRQARVFGINLVDLRIGRADVPKETREAVFARMKSEREQEAAEFRAQGSEQAQRIRASADREATVIRAEAEKEADILRGQGEGLRTEILNNAYGQDSAFFNFYRSMQAYEGVFDSDGTLMVLTPDSEFFDFFNRANPTGNPLPPALPAVSSGDSGSDAGETQSGDASGDGESGGAASGSESSGAAASGNAAQ